MRRIFQKTIISRTIEEKKIRNFTSMLILAPKACDGRSSISDRPEECTAVRPSWDGGGFLFLDLPSCSASSIA